MALKVIAFKEAAESAENCLSSLCAAIDSYFWNPSNEARALLYECLDKARGLLHRASLRSAESAE